MDARGGKILEFLKENSHLDLEVPDIAFNAKKSEKIVEAALKKFKQQGLVTSRQNEFGREYWYALPSAPTTGTIKTDEETIAAAAGEEKEVDIISLPKAEPPPATTKRRKSEKKQTAPAKKAREAAPAIKPEPIQPVEPPAVVTEPEQVVEAASGDFELDAPVSQPAEIVLAEEQDRGKMKPSVNAGGSLPLFAAVALIGLLSLIALVRSGGATKKIEAMGKTIPNDVVATADFKPVQEQAAKIGELEAKVSALSAKVDTLSSALAKVKEHKTPPPPVGHPARRKR